MLVYEVYVDDGDSYTLVYKSHKPEEGAIISPHLQRGVNKSPSFEFTILPGHAAYGKFKRYTSYVYVFRKSSQWSDAVTKCIFRGRVSEVKTDIFKQRQISCEGDLSFLSDSVQSPNTFVQVETVNGTKKQRRVTSTTTNVKMTYEAFFESLIATHNDQMTDSRKQFTVGTVNVTKKGDKETFSITSYSDTSSLISSELIAQCGGIVRTRYVDDVPYIDWIEEYTANGTQDIEFGVNLLELDEEKANDKIWSVLLPIGKDNLTISSVNGGSNYLVNEAAVNKYGRIIHYHKFDDIKKASELKSKAEEYLNLHSKVYPDNLVVKAVDLRALGTNAGGALELGDLIQVTSEPHGINRRMPCIEEDIDIQNPENSSFTIGSIVPPDNKKKSISSQQSTHHHSTQTSLGAHGTAIDGLQRDVDTLGNNVNVNAENIAINARNIAINAEDIAVTAKNISITAEAIDLKVSSLTATFGDEMDDLTASITATAESIKTEMQNKIDGVKSTVQQTASSWSSTISDLNDDLSSTISNSIDGISLEVNKKLYGDNQDGSGGIVHDYRSRIHQTASSITLSVSDFSASNTTKTGSIKLFIDTEGDGSPVTEITSKTINLNGFVNVSELEVEKGRFQSLITGEDISAKILADELKVLTKLNIGDSNNNAELRYHGSVYAPVTIKMGSSGAISPVRPFIGYYIANSDDYGSPYDLDHSHSVTTNDDGTITLGAAVKTSANNRSFKIADTKTYKDGVSAARIAGQNSVWLRAARLSESPGYRYSEATSDYNYPHITVSIQSRAAHSTNLDDDKTRDNDVVINATLAKSAGIVSGRNSVSLLAARITPDTTPTFQDATSQHGPQYTFSVQSRTQYSSDGSNHDHKSNNTSLIIDASAARSAGYDSGYSVGRNSVGVSYLSVSGDPTVSSWSNQVVIASIETHLSNGKVDTRDQDVDAKLVYRNGWNDSFDNVLVDSVTLNEGGHTATVWFKNREYNGNTWTRFKPSYNVEVK